jgi:alpha-L-fucosidase
MTGHRDAKQWLPAECDVSIRPGWFWHEKENARVKTGRELLELYYKSVGRGASFLLNVPPDRRGILHEADVASLKEFGRLVRETFGKNLARGKGLEVAVRGEWNVVRLREDIAQGQRVDAFAVDGFVGGKWTTLAEGTSIGSCRILRLGTLQTARKLRVRILQSSGPVALTEFGCYREAL